MPRGTKAPKDWPADPVNVMSIGAVGQARAAVLLGDLVAEDRADGAVDVADRDLGPQRLARLEDARRERQELGHVERPLQAVVLLTGAAQVLAREGADGRARAGSA